jgi:hypothetical protein
MQLIRLLKEIPDSESDKTKVLLARFSQLRSKGYLTKKELLEILRWKSPRPLRHYELNSEAHIREVTKLAFSTKNDCLRLHILTALRGVNYPSASAILMFYDPKKYPVLDIRVWKQLFRLKLVTSNSRGQNFTIQQCEEYLKIIRGIAKERRLTARQVEKRLFDFDRKTQVRPIYKASV